MSYKVLILNHGKTEFCNMVIDKYLSIGNIEKVAKEFEINKSTLSVYISQCTTELEEKYPKKMLAFHNMKKEYAKRRARKKKRIKVEDYRTSEKAIVLTNEHLKELPKEIKYNKFIDFCANFKTQKSVNKLIEEAKKYGVKVVL